MSIWISQHILFERIAKVKIVRQSVFFFLIRKGFINVCVHSNSCNRSRNFIFLMNTAKNPSQGISFRFQTLVFAWHFRQSYRNLQWPCLGKRPRNPSLRLAETDNLFPKWLDPKKWILILYCKMCWILFLIFLPVRWHLLKVSKRWHRAQVNQSRIDLEIMFHKCD